MDDSNRRKSGRLVCVGLVSTIGLVPDLSAGGCRIRCRRLLPFALGTVYTFALSGEGSEIVVHGKITRRQRTGLLTFEYGIEFIELSGEQRAAIGELCKTTAVKRLVPTVEEAAARAAA